MKTDLQKILSVSGEPGLFQFLSQAKNGVIAESLTTKKRTVFGSNAKVTSLSDISIYTDNEEVSLKELLKKMCEKLGDESAPGPKSDDKVLVSFFSEVLPEYDRDRFYLSHMKKVVGWYNLLKDNASLDFTEEEEKDNKEESEKNDSSEE